MRFCAQSYCFLLSNICLISVRGLLFAKGKWKRREPEKEGRLGIVGRGNEGVTGVWVSRSNGRDLENNRLTRRHFPYTEPGLATANLPHSSDLKHGALAYKAELGRRSY